MEHIAHIGDRPKMLRFMEILLQYIYYARFREKSSFEIRDSDFPVNGASS